LWVFNVEAVDVGEPGVCGVAADPASEVSVADPDVCAFADVSVRTAV
jgi:hypothetical protein